MDCVACSDFVYFFQGISAVIVVNEALNGTYIVDVLVGFALPDNARGRTLR